MRSTRLFPLALVLVLSAAVTLAKDEKKPMADEFTGVFISMNAPGAMGQPVQIWVESYTADDAAQQLATTLSTKGQQGLLNAITNLHVGNLRIGTSNGYPISVARQRANADGSRTVFLVSNRPFSGFSSGSQVDQYPFGVIELNLKADGTGEGQIIGTAQLALDEANKNLKIASYAVQPGRISDVKAKKKNK